MLVSIGRLNDEGFKALFGHGKCGSDGEKVGEILRNAWRVYKVEHEEGLVNAVIETLSLDKLH